MATKRISVCLLLAALSGCQVWLDVDAPQCDSDKACASLLGAGYTCASGGICVPPESADAGDDRPALDARWQCVREAPRNFIPDPDKRVTLRMDVVDVISMQVPDGLVLTACTPGDIACDRPVADNIAPGSDGFLELELPYGFEGFFRLVAPSYVTSLSYDVKPVTESYTTSGPSIIKPDILAVFSEGSGTTADPESTGLVFVEVRDCNDNAGDGVRFDPVDEIMPFYFQGALPSNDLTVTAISNQIGTGREARAIGGLAGVKPGYKTFQGVLPETEDVVSRITVQVRAGYITYVRLRAGYK